MASFLPGATPSPTRRIASWTRNAALLFAIAWTCLVLEKLNRYVRQTPCRAADPEPDATPLEIYVAQYVKDGSGVGKGPGGDTGKGPGGDVGKGPGGD